MKKNRNSTTTTGVIWSAIERFSSQGLQFVFGIIIARLLMPYDYGLIGMIAIFLALSETFVQSGFGLALIQKKNRDELDYSTSFYFNIVVAIFFYFFLFFFSTKIADFYEEPVLVPLIRVIGLTIIINSCTVVQRTKLDILLDFKTQTKASVISVSLSGLIGLYLAYTGFGVWALVWQSILRRLINTSILVFYLKWLPKAGFSLIRFKSLFSFGSKVLLVGLLNSIFSNLYLIVIGKIFNASDLGYYTRAKQFSDFPSTNLVAIISRVTFPILSKVQDDNEKLKSTYRQLIKLTAFIVFPFMVGLAALSKPFILLILTEKWSESIWMLQLLAFAGMWYPINILNLNILNVKGRSDLFLKLEVIKKIITVFFLILSIQFGLNIIIISQIVIAIISIFINTYYTKKIIGYGVGQQLKDVFKTLFLSIIMGISVFYLINIFNNLYVQLSIGIFVSVFIYFSSSYFLKMNELTQMVKYTKQFIYKN